MPPEAARQRRLCSCKAFTDLSSEQRPLRRHGLRIACGCVPRRERSLRRSSSPKKVTLRLCCSLVNALATRRLATNFFRYQAVRLISFSKTSVAADCFCFVRRRKTRANAVRFYFPTQNFANTSFTVSSVTLLPVRLISSPRAQSMLTFTASSVSPPLSASSASLT